LQSSDGSLNSPLGSQQTSSTSQSRTTDGHTSILDLTISIEGGQMILSSLLNQSHIGAQVNRSHIQTVSTGSQQVGAFSAIDLYIGRELVGRHSHLDGIGISGSVGIHQVANSDHQRSLISRDLGPGRTLIHIPLGLFTRSSTAS